MTALLYISWLVSGVIAARFIANQVYLAKRSKGSLEVIDNIDVYYSVVLSIVGGPIALAGYVIWRFHRTVMNFFIPSARRIAEDNAQAGTLRQAAEMFPHDPFTQEVLLDAAKKLER